MKMKLTKHTTNCSNPTTNGFINDLFKDIGAIAAP